MSYREETDAVGRERCKQCAATIRSLFQGDERDLCATCVNNRGTNP
jgi:hypothetical protein